jgi:hypothetical protein
MPTDVISKIGISNTPTVMDYSTLQSWEDAAPSDLTITDQRWIGECYDRGEFVDTGANLLTFGGTVTDSTRYHILRCATGQSFSERARSAALAYDGTTGQGVALRCSTAYRDPISPGVNYVHLQGLQVKSTQASSRPVSNTGSNHEADKCLFHSASNVSAIGTFKKLTNCLVIYTGSNASTGNVPLEYPTGSAYGCTLISTAGAAYGFGVQNYGTATVKNCAVFGFTNFTQLGTGGAGFSAASDYNATSAASIPGTGTHNLTSQTFANQFVSTTNDFRVLSTANLVGAGTPDTTNIPTDITPSPRDASAPTIGAWEYHSAPTTGTPTHAVIASGSTSLVVNVPIVRDGDLMLAFGASGFSTRMLSPPAGWTQLFRVDYSGTIGTFKHHCWWRVASSEPATYTFTLSDTFTSARVVIVPVYGAVDPAVNAIENAGSTQTTVGSPAGNVTAPSVTPSDANSLLMRVLVDARSSVGFTPPSGHAEIFDDSPAGTAWAATIATKTQGVSASGTADFISDQNWHTDYATSTIAIAPPASAVTLTTPIGIVDPELRRDCIFDATLVAVAWFDPEIVPPATPNVTATPPTIALVTAAYAPKANLGINIPLKTLSLSTFAPSVTKGTLATPGVLAITTTKFAPVVSTPRLVTPPVKALTLTAFAPAASAPRLVTPGLLALTTTKFAPQLKLTVIPGPKALSISSFAPVVSAPRLVTPANINLVTTKFAPTVTATSGVRATPGTVALATTSFAPLISTPRLVTPSLLSLVLTKYAPIATAPRLVVPGVLSLSTTKFAPRVIQGTVATPPTKALATTKFAPVVTLNIYATPGTKALALTKFAPSALAPRLVVPAKLSLILNGFAPALDNSKFISIPTLTLATTRFAPVASAPRLVTPGVANLTLTKFAPTARAPRLATPATLGINLVTLVPTAKLATYIYPAQVALVLDFFTPAVSTPQVFFPPSLVLSLVSYPPIATGVIPYIRVTGPQSISRFGIFGISDDAVKYISSVGPQSVEKVF